MGQKSANLQLSCVLSLPHFVLRHQTPDDPGLMMDKALVASAGELLTW